MKTRISLTVLACLLMSCEIDYAKIMTEKISIALGKDYDSYHTFSYPTNNFGAGSAYILQTPTDQPTDLNFWCDPESCFNLTAQQVEDIGVGGLVAVGSNGGSINLSEDERTKIGLQIMLPKIYDLLKIGAGGGYEKGVKTELTIEQAWPRKLRRKAVMEKIQALPDNDRMKDAFKHGLLALVVGDVVIKSMKVSLTVDKSVKANLDAALTANVGKVLGDGAKLEFSVGSTTNGTYTLVTTRPVVVKALVGRQPQGGVLEGDDDWKEWTRTDLTQEGCGRTDRPACGKRKAP